MTFKSGLKYFPSLINPDYSGSFLASLILASRVLSLHHQTWFLRYFPSLTKPGLSGPFLASPILACQVLSQPHQSWSLRFIPSLSKPNLSAPLLASPILISQVLSQPHQTWPLGPFPSFTNPDFSGSFLASLFLVSCLFLASSILVSRVLSLPHQSWSLKSFPSLANLSLSSSLLASAVLDFKSFYSLSSPFLILPYYHSLDTLLVWSGVSHKGQQAVFLLHRQDLVRVVIDLPLLPLLDCRITRGGNTAQYQAIVMCDTQQYSNTRRQLCAIHSSTAIAGNGDMRYMAVLHYKGIVRCDTQQYCNSR